MSKIAFVNYDDAAFVTHSGKFHADEVMATAILLKIRERVLAGEISEEALPEVLRGKFSQEPIRLCRISLAPENNGGRMVYDVGGGEFDHHQKERNGQRENGIFYAAVGLIWRAFGMLLCDGSKELWQAIDELLIQVIDCGDNGQFPVIENGLPILNFDELIGDYNPRWNEDQGADFQNMRFAEAVEFAEGIFERIMRKEKAVLAAVPEVEAALEKSEDGIIIFDRYVTWEDTLIKLSATDEKAKGILLAIVPSNRDAGAYIIQSPRENNKSRMYLPEAWRGKKGEDLNDLVEGGTFCHATGFLAVADNLEHAISMAKLAIMDFRKQ